MFCHVMSLCLIRDMRKFHILNSNIYLKCEPKQKFHFLIFKEYKSSCPFMYACMYVCMYVSVYMFICPLPMHFFLAQLFSNIFVETKHFFFAASPFGRGRRGKKNIAVTICIGREILCPVCRI